MNLPDLLEPILVHLSNLSVKDLTLAQRVNSQWRDVIVKAELFQQQLFMSPEPASAALIWRKPITPTADWTAHVSVNPPEFSQGKPILRFNPRIKTGYLARYKTYLSPMVSMRVFGNHEWERSYLTQPPCTEAEIRALRVEESLSAEDFDEEHFLGRKGPGSVVKSRSGRYGTLSEWRSEIVKPRGITLGQIVTEMRRQGTPLKSRAMFRCIINGHIESDSPYVTGKLGDIPE